jgi:hypothetical protein
MGKMKALLYDAEYVFTGGDELWERWADFDDHGLLVYAFAGGRWSWMAMERETTLEDAFFIGGEGVSGDSPIICHYCARDLGLALSMVPNATGGYETTDAPKQVTIQPLELSRQEQALKQCPCGNYLFNLVEAEELEAEFERGEMPYTVLIDFSRELAYAFEEARGYQMRRLQPVFLAGDKE